MIPRYQLVTFRVLVGGTLLMALLMVRGCVKAHERIAAARDSSPIPAPTDMPDESVSVALANDADGSIQFDRQQMALPKEGSLRAQTLLQKVLAGYATPASLHPLPGGPAIAAVYFVTQPDVDGPSASGQLAVIDLKSSYVDRYPSGIESEYLTLESLIGSLHANFPAIASVRFLVDGKVRDTLAGHADIRDEYPAIDTARYPLHPLGQGK
jgi:hypothetical protein